MSSFDKRVCQWLNDASIPAKSKQTILNRMSVGIANYRSLELEKLTTVPGAKLMNDCRIDYSLQDQIAKAMYRLEAGDEGSPSDPLFPDFEIRAGGTAATTPAIGGPPKAPSSEVTADPPPRDAESSMATFTFGDATAADAPFTAPPANAAGDEEDNVDAGEEDEAAVEAMRLRMVKRQSRNAVSAAPINIAEARNFQLRKVPKSSDIVKRIVKTLEAHHLFLHLEDEDIVAAAEAMEMSSFKRGERIALKGQSNEQMYVVLSGSVVGVESRQKVNVGGTFGDVGLLHDVQNADTFEATMNNTQVCHIDRLSYQSLCSRASQEKRERYEGFLERVETLKMLTPGERLQIADALKTSKYVKGEKIITYGDDGNWFFLIVEGVVDVIGRDEGGNEVKVCSFSVGCPIGELELLHKHKAVADCVASSDRVKVAKMSGRHFEKVIGSAKEFLERQAATDEVYTYYRSKRKTSQ